MKRKIICMALIFVLVFTAFAFADSNEEKGVKASSKLTFSSGSAICKTEITYAGQTIKATMKLYKGSVLIGTWSDQATGSLNMTGSRTAVSGQTYTLTVTASVNGSPISVPPITKTAP